jgi:hypothetical protein
MMTPLRVSIVASVLAFTLLLVIFELVRKRRLQERYALLWVLTGFVMLAMALWRDLLGRLSSLVGIYYPPSALFLLGYLFVLALLLHDSTVISRLSHQNAVLAQRLALLEAEVKAPEELVPDGGQDPGSP